MVYNIIMENRTIKNVFTPEEVSEIKKFIEDEVSSRERLIWNSKLEEEKPDLFKEYKLDERMGRLVIENLYEMPFGILTKIHRIARSINPTAQYQGATYCEYSGKYGVPTLDMHTDRGDNENICLDYQIDANISWPIIISDETYTHENNDIIVFKTTKEIHGRPQTHFNEDDFVRVIFFYFACGDSNA